MNRFRWIALALTLCALTGTGIAPAQTTPPSAPAPAAAPMPQDLLDSLLAPIALYPDQLLSQVLMASTYPLEVVEAARFVRANPGLKGEDLDRALQGMPWDASVLSLCAFPQVLDMMDTKLEWTQRLGDAFLADTAAVMNTVQGLRQRAQQAGNLQTTPQQNVVVQDRTIVIEPAQSEYVYVPVYNPEIIYGPWWAPAYTPWYWYPGPTWGYPVLGPGWGYGAGIFWGTAWAIGSYNWGWCRPDWRGHSIHVNVHGNNSWVNRPHYRDRYANNPKWSHAPEHRRGVAYRDPGTAQRYRPANAGAIQARESYRGRDVATGSGYGGGSGRTAPGAGSRVRPGQGATGGSGRVGQGATSGVGRAAPGAATRPSPGASGSARGLARADTGATMRAAPAPQRPGDAGSTMRSAPARDRYGSVGTTTRPTAPATRAMTRAAPASSQFATRSAPAASYPRPAYRPESRQQVQRDAARGAQSRAAMTRPALPSMRSAQPAPQSMRSAQPAPQSMRGGSGAASRPSGPSAPSGGQRGSQGGGQMRHR